MLKYWGDLQSLDLHLGFSERNFRRNDDDKMNFFDNSIKDWNKIWEPFTTLTEKHYPQPCNPWRYFPVKHGWPGVNRKGKIPTFKVLSRNKYRIEGWKNLHTNWAKIIQSADRTETLIIWRAINQERKSVDQENRCMSFTNEPRKMLISSIKIYNLIRAD